MKQFRCHEMVAQAVDYRSFDVIAADVEAVGRVSISMMPDEISWNCLADGEGRPRTGCFPGGVFRREGAPEKPALAEIDTDLAQLRCLHFGFHALG